MLSFAFRQVTDQVNKISNLKDTIQKLIVDKVSLQSRIEVLEQGDPSVEMEMRRLREENSTLRGQLATAAKEKLKITWEHDPLHREGIKQLVDGPLVRLDDASAISGDGGGISVSIFGVICGSEQWEHRSCPDCVLTIWAPFSASRSCIVSARFPVTYKTWLYTPAIWEGLSSTFRPPSHRSVLHRRSMQCLL